MKQEIAPSFKDVVAKEVVKIPSSGALTGQSVDVAAEIRKVTESGLARRAEKARQKLISLFR
jgi:hypothetical protein